MNQSSVISYQLSEKSQVYLGIYDIAGSEVSILENEEKEQGKYRINFNAENLQSGVYFCRMVAGEGSVTKKMVVVR